MSAVTKSIPRPPSSVLRRPLQSAFKTHIYVAGALSLIAGFAYYQLVRGTRLKNYQRFHETWDDKRHYQRMVDAGVFQYVKSDTQAPDWIQSYEKEVDQAIKSIRK